MSYLDKQDTLIDVQHGFRESHSCETQLITTIREIARNLDQSSKTGIIFIRLFWYRAASATAVKMRSLRPTGRDKELDSGMALR